MLSQLFQEQHLEIVRACLFGPSHLQMRCSRNTIRLHLKLQSQHQPVIYGPRAARGQACAFLGLPAPACRGSSAGAAQGDPRASYEGGYSILTSFLLRLKTKATETVVLFEIKPGEQMQVEFTDIRRGRDPLLAFVATLDWSRASYVVFSRREDSAAWCSGIEKALRFFGGTPRKLLFDNAKTIIQECEVYGPGEHR